MLKSVLLPQVIMNKTENFHKVRIGRLNLWGMFRYELETIEHFGLVVMARIDFETESKVAKNFYPINSFVSMCLNQFSDKKILEIFSKRFSNIVYYNNYEFQDKEIEVNKKYKSRYQFHNKFIKRYVLTSKRKKKGDLIDIMSKKNYWLLYILRCIMW